MKSFIYLAIILFSIQAQAQEVKFNKVQFLCSRVDSNVDRPQTLVLTQVDHSIEDGFDVFSYSSDSNVFSDAEVKTVIEMYSESVDLKEAQVSFKSLSNRRYFAKGKTSRMDTLMQFEENDAKLHQFSTYFRNGKMGLKANFFHPELGGQFECAKAYPTNYQPAEDVLPETYKEEMMEEVHASLATEEEYAID